MRQFHVHLVYHSRFGFLLDTEEEMEERDEDEDEEERRRGREKRVILIAMEKEKKSKRFNDAVVLSSFPRYMTKGILSKETTVIHQ